MSKTFTFDHLILLAYNETNPKTTEEICSHLEQDEELMDDYLSIQSVKDELDQLFCDPTDDIISGLINYSRALEVISVKPDVYKALIIKN
jgi:hypothetical protein